MTKGTDKQPSQQNSVSAPNLRPDDSSITPPAADNTKSPDNSGANSERTEEIGGQKGPEPTRYGDWEKNGRCTDF